MDGVRERETELMSLERNTPAWRREHAGSGVTSGLILSYVERVAGQMGVGRMLSMAGLAEREQELRDENAWFSYDTKIALWDAAVAVTGDPRLPERVGESVLDFTVALGLKRALRALGSPDFVYRNVVRANGRFNWAHTLDLTAREKGWARLEYRDVSGVGYHVYDCTYSIGLLRAVPQLFGLPPARVLHPTCGAQGGDHCEFEIHWADGLQKVKRSALLGAAFSAALVAAGALWEPALLAAGAGLGMGTAGIVGTRTAAFMRGRIEALESRVHEQDLAAEEQLKSLAALSSELRLEEVLERITHSAGSAIGGAEFALLVADQDRMRADRHSGIPHESLSALEAWADGSRQALHGGSIVIDDLAEVPELEALTVSPERPAGSMCAAPMVFHDRLLGVLIALARGTMVFLPQDVRALETYAGHAAIALSNARLVGELEREAAEDPLTGLANKRVFHLAYSTELSRAARENSSVALVILDLDHFKRLNDAYGHPFGDSVLVAVGNTLRTVVRGHDTVARLGGEEFALLLPGATPAEAQAVADRARAQLQMIALPDGRLSCSAGVAVVSGAGAHDSDLFDAADRALYEAKRLGRGRTVLGSTPAETRGLSAAV